MPRFNTSDHKNLSETMKHYLDKYQGDIICPLQIWYEALGGYGAPTPADMNAMGAVLDGLDKWKPVGETRYEKFGKQPSYSRA